MPRLTRSEIRLIESDPAMAFIIAVERHFKAAFADMGIPWNEPKSKAIVEPEKRAFNPIRLSVASKRKNLVAQLEITKRQLCKVSGDNERLLLARIEEIEERILTLDKEEN